MRNKYTVVNNVARIKISASDSTDVLLCLVDVTDLVKLQSCGVGTWYGNRSKSKRRNYYVTGKLYNQWTRKSRTVLLHRILMVDEHSPMDVHHMNNDGLDNRRQNLAVITHRDNVRAQWPHQQWIEWDKAEEASCIRSRELEAMRMTRKQLNVTRCWVWKMVKAKRGPVYEAYQQNLNALFGIANCQVL